MDMFDMENYYEIWFEFIETPPISDNFEMADVENSNYMSNSGSLLAMILLIFLDMVFRRVINYVCLKLARFSLARRIGTYFHNPNSFRSR